MLQKMPRLSDGELLIDAIHRIQKTMLARSVQEHDKFFSTISLPLVLKEMHFPEKDRPMLSAVLFNLGLVINCTQPFHAARYQVASQFTTAELLSVESVCFAYGRFMQAQETAKNLAALQQRLADIMADMQSEKTSNQ